MLCLNIHEQSFSWLARERLTNKVNTAAYEYYSYVFVGRSTIDSVSLATRFR